MSDLRTVEDGFDTEGQSRIEPPPVETNATLLMSDCEKSKSEIESVPIAREDAKDPSHATEPAVDNSANDVPDGGTSAWTTVWATVIINFCGLGGIYGFGTLLHLMAQS